MEPQDNLDPTLLLRYLEASDPLTADEQAQVEQWLRRDPQHPKELDQLRQLWEQSGQAGSLAQVDPSADWPATWARMQQTASTPTVRPLNPSPRFALWRVAAAIALLLTAAGGAWYLTHDLSEAGYTHVAEDTVTVVSLPDGSQVFLNKMARLSYDDDFGGATRAVRLEGEGYFEVTHNPTTPFLIHTGETEVRVVGTTFNVRADSQSDGELRNGGVCSPAGHAVADSARGGIVSRRQFAGVCQRRPQLPGLENRDPYL